MTNDRRIESWNELLDALYADAWADDISRFRSSFVFRGLPSAQFTLATSLMRLGPNGPTFEGHLLRNFRKYATRYVRQGESYWHWLAMAQHHGLPTRLMDWTFSPLVALHFLTALPEQYRQDGVIWCADYKQIHHHLPGVLADQLNCEGADVFTVEMLGGLASLAEFDQLAQPDVPFALFLEPPSLDDRIVNQYALFSVVSDPTLGMDTWLERHPDAYRRIVVPSELKWEIRDKLDQANVNERVLFPGLDGLSSWLRRQYLPVGVGA